MSGQQYRQLTHRLRIDQGPGKPDRISERPRTGSRDQGWRYLDSDEKPTLVTFTEADRVDVDFLLKTGAIQPWTPPVKPDKKGG